MVHQPGEQQLRDRVDQAGAADALGRHVAADDLQVDALPELDAFDRSNGGAHSALDLAAFERGPRRCGRGQRALRTTEHDLAVCADVDEDTQPVLAHHAGGQHARHDVGSHVGP